MRTHRKIKKEDLRRVIDTLRSTPSQNKIIRHIGPGEFNILPRKLRATNIDQTECAALKQLIYDPIQSDNIPPRFWTIWGELILKYRIRKTVTYVDIRTTVRKVTLWAAETPFRLANIDKKQAIAMGRSF